MTGPQFEKGSSGYTMNITTASGAEQGSIDALPGLRKGFSGSSTPLDSESAIEEESLNEPLQSYASTINTRMSSMSAKSSESGRSGRRGGDSDSDVEFVEGQVYMTYVLTGGSKRG